MIECDVSTVVCFRFPNVLILYITGFLLSIGGKRLGTRRNPGWHITLLDLFGFYNHGENFHIRDLRFFSVGTYGGVLDNTIFMAGHDNGNCCRSVLVRTFPNVDGVMPDAIQNISAVAEDNNSIYSVNSFSSRFKRHILSDGVILESSGPLWDLPLSAFTMVYHEGWLYAMGGYLNGHLTNKVWMINVTTGVVVEGPSMLWKRAKSASCIFPMGGATCIVIAGGCGEADGVPSVLLDSVEILDLTNRDDVKPQWVLGDDNKF